MTLLLLQQHLQAIVTVLALVNPLMCGALFARIEDQPPRQVQIADAAKAALAVLVILVLAALVGVRILQVFGVSLDAFSVAGGGVLSWIGFSMLASSAAADHPAARTDAHRSLTPLIVFAASPGTVTGVITLSVAHGQRDLPVTALVAVVVAVLLMWVAMLLVAHMGSRAAGNGFARDTLTQLMGLIVIAMGVQFALSGIRAFMMDS